jgi:uncharacterized protein YukE
MGIAQQIGAELDTLLRQVGPLHDFWQGRSHEGWKDLQTMWNNAANDLMTSSGTLGAISHTVQTNAVNYDNCETSNAQTWAH